MRRINFRLKFFKKGWQYQQFHRRERAKVARSIPATTAVTTWLVRANTAAGARRWPAITRQSSRAAVDAAAPAARIAQHSAVAGRSHHAAAASSRHGRALVRVPAQGRRLGSGAWRYSHVQIEIRHHCLLS